MGERRAFQRPARSARRWHAVVPCFASSPPRVSRYDKFREVTGGRCAALRRKQLPISDAERHDWLRGYWNQLMAKDLEAALPACLAD
ncbi:MAG: hypothetical protein IPM40_08625 [Gammaproteobacteria bacterium]|nr:hypothetical protein [Gammaproteobacteria bacterium]